MDDTVINFELWLTRLHNADPIYATDVGTHDSQLLTALLMQGVIDNDYINNNNEPTEWDSAEQAAAVYMEQYDRELKQIVWDPRTLTTATRYLQELMTINGNLPQP